MERGAVRELAVRLGLGEPRVVRKAEEYLRLSQVKCTGLMTHVTATGLAVMCLELAARCAKHPTGKSSFIKLSGLNKTAYQSSMKALECLLGVNARLGMRDLAVQFCCTEAVNAASEILQRYESSLPEAQQTDLDFSKPLFITAALFTACRGEKKYYTKRTEEDLELLVLEEMKFVFPDWSWTSNKKFCMSLSEILLKVKERLLLAYLCLKLKVDKAKMLAVSGVKKAIFDRLCTQMEKISQQLSKDGIPLAAETSETLQTDPEQCEKEGSEDYDDEIPCKQPKTETKQDYEEWKRRILENAAKAQETNSGTVSIVPPCNVTTACS